MNMTQICRSAVLKAESLLRPRRTALLFLLVLLTIASPQIAGAQNDVPEEGFGPILRPNNELPRWLIDELIANNPPAADVTAADVQTSSSNPSLIIDSDFGVDDTVAVAALLSLEQGIAETPIPVEIQAIVTVAGVTTVENATYNAELLLAQYGLDSDDIPVIVGANKPEKRKLSSTGKLIHGPDGLWWLAQITREQQIDAASHKGKGKGKGPSKKAKDFYCKDANLSGATLLTLGPLTNVAEAIKKCQKTFEQAEGLHLIVLGGADMTGTESPPMGNESPIVGRKTPVTEYNFWQDPEAAQYVFDFARPQKPGEMPVLKITVIPQNTFAQYVIGYDEIIALATSQNAVGQWLTAPVYGPPYQPPMLPPPYDLAWGPLPIYYGVQASNGFAPGVPDLVAAAYAVVPDVQRHAESVPSVVSIFGDSKASAFVGGQSLMAQSILVPAVDPGGDSLEFDIAIGTTEQIAQDYDDKTLSNLANAVFANDEPFYPDNGLLADFLFGAIAAPPNNADVVAQIDPELVRGFLRDTLTAPFPSAKASVVDASASAPEDGATQDERIFVPFIATE